MGAVAGETFATLLRSGQLRKQRASRIVWHAPASGSYYIEGGSYLTDVGTYTLTIAVP